MKKKILTLLFSIVSVLSIAQSHTIMGNVLSSSEDNYCAYNVILLHTQDSSFYKGDFFMDSKFSIETAELPILVKITSMGFVDKLILVDKIQLNIPDIELEESATTLSEVVVNANIPPFSAKSDRLTMNVGNTVLSQSGTAVDVLQKAARVQIDNSGNVSVLGVGNALILVDGRMLPSNQALESISSSDIQKIDIITNPSAKYDASGKAVIEITTKKARNNGWGGEVTARIGKGNDWRKYIGTELSAKVNNLSLFASYAYAPAKREYSETYERNYPENISIWNDIETQTNMRNNHNFRLSTEYRLTDEHTVGVQLSGEVRDSQKDILNINNISENKDKTTITSIQDGTLNRNYLSGTAFYTFKPVSEKLLFNLLFDKSHFDTSDKIEINENDLLKNNNTETNININSINADLEINLPNEYQLDLGGKFSDISNASSTLFGIKENENSFTDYKYSENIWAAYAMLSKKHEGFSFDGGVRMEFSKYFAQSNNEVLQGNESRFNLFPNLSIAYKLSKDWDISTGYAMKISRPTFQDINPAIIYIDTLSYFQGNPALIPEIHNKLNLKFTYKSYASLTFNYTRKSNMLGWYIDQDINNPAVTKATQKNIDKSDIYSIDLMLPYQNKLLTCYLATGVILTNTNDKMANIVDLNKPMWYAYSGVNANLPYKIKFGTNVRYFTKGVENIFYFDPVFRMDLSLQKTFCNDKLSTTLSWNDVFRSDKMNTYTTLNERYIRYNYYYDQSVVQLSISYRFRSAKTKYKSKSAIKSEERRIKGF